MGDGSTPTCGCRAPLIQGDTGHKDDNASILPYLGDLLRSADHDHDHALTPVGVQTFINVGNIYAFLEARDGCVSVY